MSNLILTSVPVEELVEALRTVVREEIRAEQLAKDQTQLISGNQVRDLFNPAISRPTLASYVSRGLIIEHRIGGRKWYKKGEVLSAVTKIKRYSPAASITRP